MKHKLQQKIARLVSLGLIVIGLQSHSYAASILSFDQSLVETTVNGQFTLDIVATDFPSTFGGTILINFDPSIVNVSDIGLASPWQGVTLTPTDNSGIGTASMLLYAPSLYQWPAGDFIFATLLFSALGEGSTELALSTYAPLPLATYSGGSLTPVDFAAINTTVHVSAVPIPAAIWLLLSGIIGLFTLANKRRDSAFPSRA